MSEHISKQDSERYRNRVMTSDELFATSFHLAICDTCHSRFVSDDVLDPGYEFIRDQLKAARDEEPEHITHQEIAAYVDQKLSWSDREIVETHFEICSHCNRLADRLRLISAERSVDPAASATRSPRVLTDRRRAPAWRIPIGIAGAAAAAALLIWFVAQAFRTQVADLQTQVQQLRQTNEGLSQEISNIEGLKAQLEQFRSESERLRQENVAARAAIDRLEEQLTVKAVRSPRRDSIFPPPVALNDKSGPVGIDEHGNITGIDSLSSSHEQLIKLALATGQIETPASIAKLRGKAGKTMGNGSSISFRLVTPVCTVIETDHPTFRWEPVAGAAGYTVTLLDSRLNKVITSPLLQTNNWQITSRLKRGGIYYWQVKAVKDGKEIVSPAGAGADVRFKILEQAGLDRLERARRQYDSHLALAVSYAEMGLLDEAEKEIEALASANPSSDVVQSLRRSLRKARSN